MIQKIENNKIYITKTAESILYSVTTDNAEECFESFREYGIEHSYFDPETTSKSAVRIDREKSGAVKYFGLNIDPEDIKELYRLISNLEESGYEPKVILV